MIQTTTYSMWQTFLNCRRKFQWRYLQNLIPLERNLNFRFGSLVHQCLEIWHRDQDLDKVLNHINLELPMKTDQDKKSWHLATAMMLGYVRRYPQEDFEVISLERVFQGNICDPATKTPIPGYVLAGIMDGIVRIGDEYFLLEHKTAATIDSGYLEKLWTDMQIILYSHYARKVLGFPIRGVIYNVLLKAKLKQRVGETEAEYEVRRAELIKKSKSGKTTAKRQLPETDEAFQGRLAEKYDQPDMFHREYIYISSEQFRQIEEEVYQLALSLQDAQWRNFFPPNRGHCFHFGRPCAYLQLCKTGGDEITIENFYERKAPHGELLEAGYEPACGPNSPDSVTEKSKTPIF